MKEPRLLVEALGHIEKAGSLTPMRLANDSTIDRLWRHIQDQKLARLTKVGNLLWELTDLGRERLRRETPPTSI